MQGRHPTILPVSEAVVIRVACVGAGYFSQFHYDSWRRMAGAQAVAACDLDRGKATATGLTAYTDLAEMLARESPDLLDIIVPPDGHAAAIRAALAAGVRWMICQKPFCRDLAEAEALVAEVRQAGATVIVHENFRFQPWYRRIKALIKKGEIGPVHQATFRLRPGDGQGPRAYLDRQPYFQTMPRFLIHETGVHWIDTFRYLFGDPVAVYADLRQINPMIAGEDAGLVLFDHPGGVRAVFDGNRHLDHAAENHRKTMGEAWVEGSEGVLALRGDGSVWHRGFGALDWTERLGPDRSPGFGGDCVHALQSHVIASMTTAAPLENTVEAYLAVLRIEAAIYASAQAGAKQVLDLAPPAGS